MCHVSPGFQLLLLIYFVGFLILSRQNQGILQAMTVDFDTNQIYLATSQHRYRPSPGHISCFCCVGKKVRYVFFRKIKDTFFIFTNNFIDFNILGMSAISRYWLLV